MGNNYIGCSFLLKTVEILFKAWQHQPNDKQAIKIAKIVGMNTSRKLKHGVIRFIQTRLSSLLHQNRQQCANFNFSMYFYAYIILSYILMIFIDNIFPIIIIFQMNTRIFWLLLLFVALVGLADALSAEGDQNTMILFKQWASKLGMDFGDQTQYRYQVFKTNLHQITLHNLDPEKTFTKALNKFCFLTNQQFKTSYLSPARAKPDNIVIKGPRLQFEEINWVDKNLVSPVVEQGPNCSCAYAFTAAGLIQAYYAQQQELANLVVFSAQQIIDCTLVPPYSNNGCNGGNVGRSVLYLKKLGYKTVYQNPYVQRVQPCNQNDMTLVPNMNIIQTLGGDKYTLYAALKKGPVAVHVFGAALQHYSKGSISSSSCVLQQGVIPVLLVGYFKNETNQTNGTWFLKSSFGSTWGRNGFFQISQEDSQSCGICTDYVHVQKPQTPKPDQEEL